MATRTQPVGDWTIRPDSSGSVYPTGYANKTTNQINNSSILVFKKAGRVGVDFRFVISDLYVGSPSLVLPWTATDITNNVRWELDYYVVPATDDANNADPASVTESVGVTDTAPTTAHNVLRASVALTAGNLSTNGELFGSLFRDGADAADTMTGEAFLFRMLFSFSDA